MSPHALDRRSFLGMTGAVTTATLTTSTLHAKSVRTRPVAARVRKEVNTLSTTEIAEYRNAVKIQRDRSVANLSDPKGWRGQANIHQDFCPHGNWFFLPWHRAYLYYFEEICREALGAGSTFALPYWDWTKNPLLPAPFWGPDNALNDLTRELDPNDAIPPEVVGQTVIDNILGITDFETFASSKALTQRPNDPPFGFQGQLESVPHNNVHGFISGNMGSYMSPLDPIFWLHHANIDRLWTEWVKLHPTETTADVDWLNFEVNSFFDLNGQAAKKKVSDLLSTYALGYRYDTQPEEAPVAAGPGAATPVIPQGFVAMVQPHNAATTVSPLSSPVTLSQALSDRITTAARANTRSKTIRLILKDVPVPENQKFLVRVFLNCKNPNPRTPVGDPTYVGSFSFFQHEHATPAAGGGHAGMAAAPRTKTSSFSFDISEVVRRLEKAGEYQAQGDLKVSLVPVPIRRGQAVIGEVKPGKIEIVGLQ